MSNNTRWEPRDWDGSSRPFIAAKREKRPTSTAWLSMLVSMMGLVCILGWGVTTVTEHIDQVIHQQQEVVK